MNHGDTEERRLKNLCASVVSDQLFLLRGLDLPHVQPPLS